MRHITKQTVGAFNTRKPCHLGNTVSDGQALTLFGNRIAEWRNGELWITNAGWKTNTTKERLNGLSGVRVHQNKGQWFLNGRPWNGQWIKVEPTSPKGLEAV